MMHPSTPTSYNSSLHDALPICDASVTRKRSDALRIPKAERALPATPPGPKQGPHQWVCAGLSSGGGGSPASSRRSEEHTSELQSPCNLVCRLLLEKKKKILDAT